MEVECVKMQMKYCEDERFQSYSLTSWPKISKMFPKKLSKMLENVSIDGRHIMSLIQICHCCVKRNKETLMAHTLTLHAK
jgi:hypothetical protein